MDDIAMKSLKNIEKYVHDIKCYDIMLKQLLDSNAHIAQSLANIEKMMEQSWGAYSHTLRETEQAARRVQDRN